MSAGGKVAGRETRLVDTNVVSFLVNDRPPVDQYRPLLRGHELILCFMTVAELYEGVYRANWGVKKLQRLLRILEDFTVIESSPEICHIWAEIRTLRKRQPISTDDAWIAATALAYGCPLVTHNPKDFKGIPRLQIITAAEA